MKAHPDRLPLLLFYGHYARRPGPGPWMLSNFWPATFVVDGQRYAHVEQFMMAGKARRFGDTLTLGKILSETRPGTVKLLGRQVQSFDKSIWDRESYGVVLAGVVAKFGQNAELKSYLLSTAPAVLVEAAPSDRIWGIGLSATDPAAHDPRAWRGQNLLGFALTECRRMLTVDAG